MPVYEYACRACGERFEELILGSERPTCPSCSGTSLEKLPSAFGVQAGEVPAGVPAGGACGTCGDPRGPGACSL